MKKGVLMPKLFEYQLTDKEVIENVFDNEAYLMNHVVMPVGKTFPKHPTDAEVTIIVLRGTLSAQANDNQPVLVRRGQVMQVPKGTESLLFNAGEDVVELMVLKVR